MTSSAGVQQNLEDARDLIRDAAAAGADLVVLPENFASMSMQDSDRLAIAEAPGSGPIQQFLADQARQNQVWLVGGTIALRSEDPDRTSASCLVFDSQGDMRCRYDKMHLFDVELEGGESYCESDYIQPGNDIAVCETPWAKLGIAICYDLRFPELFRGMMRHDVDLVVLPSAFTAQTGKRHWQALLQARAIENQVYMVAANQAGQHENGRQTHGHSMIIDPWGEICACLQSGTGHVSSEIDMDHMARVRQMLPSLKHRRLD